LEPPKKTKTPKEEAENDGWIGVKGDGKKIVGTAHEPAAGFD
jgi:hypothetical protein